MQILKAIQSHIGQIQVQIVLIRSLIEKADMKTKSEIQELIDGNAIEKAVFEEVTYNDSYENFYHGFLVGVLSNIDNYEIKSNRESGIGRSDIIIKYPNRRGKAVIIEIKVSKNVNDLENKCYEALNQIEEKKYDMELVQDGYKDILKYGIAFYKKDCMIKCKNHL